MYIPTLTIPVQIRFKITIQSILVSMNYYQITTVYKLINHINMKQITALTYEYGEFIITLK